LFLRDRDELPRDAVDKLLATRVVAVLDRRELENYLLDKSAICEVLRLRLEASGPSASTPSPEEVESWLREAADQAKQAVVLKRVASRLSHVRLLSRNLVTEIAREPGGPTLASLTAALLAALPSNSIQEEVERLWSEEQTEVDDTWDECWPTLAPGADLLAFVWGRVGLHFEKTRDPLLLAQRQRAPEDLRMLVSSFLDLAVQVQPSA
jgi:hypothetical protein